MRSSPPGRAPGPDRPRMGLRPTHTRAARSARAPMYVSKLSATDFRSYAQVDIDFDPGVTALVGPNGQGKTNLIEAIGYLATLGSHRVSLDAPMVREGAERAIVRGVVVQDGRDTLLEVEVTPGRANRARRGGAALPKARDLLGTLRTVLFA